MIRLLALWMVAIGTVAHAEPIVLRFASPAPEGTSWAREGRAFGRDIETLTKGQVKIKYYLGGITGDEMQTAERIRRGQLDGIASGGMLCNRLAPSMRVLRVVGLFKSRAESAYVSGRLKAVFDEEFAKHGFINLGELGMGPDVLFSRTPVRNMAELRAARLWIWDLDDVYRLEMEAMGLHVVPRPIEDAAHAYDEGQVDGFIAVPTASLAFQWSARARYFNEMHVAFLRGCFLLASRAFDQLTSEQKDAVRTAQAKTLARLEDLGTTQDQQLTKTLFEKQGLRHTDSTDAFRTEFFEAAHQMREKLGDKLVPAALLTKVLGMLADYRAEHGTPASNH